MNDFSIGRTATGKRGHLLYGLGTGYSTGVDTEPRRGLEIHCPISHVDRRFIVRQDPRGHELEVPVPLGHVGGRDGTDVGRYRGGLPVVSRR